MSTMSFNFDDDDDVPTFSFGETNEVEVPTSPPTVPVTPAPEPEPVKPVEEMTDAEVDSAFDDLAAMIEQDTQVIEATAAIMAAEYEVAQAEKAMEQSAEEYERLSEERKQLEKLLSDIIAKQNEAHRKAYPMRRAKEDAVVKRDRAAKNLDVAKNNVRIKFERQKENRNFIEIAKMMPWWNGIDYKGQTLKIMPHQWTGCQFLATAKRAILGDGMGLGKSLSSIAALDLTQAKKVLIVAQADITTNFDNEVRMWAPHRRVINLRGTSKEQRNTFLDMVNLLDDVIVIINYEAWRKDRSLLERFISVGFDTLIVDEAHNIKSTDTDAYLGIKQIALSNNKCPHCKVIMPAMIDINGRPVKGAARQCTDCGWQGQSFELEGSTDEERYYYTKSVKNVWMVTGTPILNKPQDLFALLSIIDPLNFSRKNDFLYRYCDQDMYTGKWKFRSGGAQYLMQHQLSGRYLARNMEDAGIVLPPQVPTIHDIPFSELVDNYPQQREVIDQITHHGQILMNSGAKLPMIAQIAVITRQRQANVWPGGISWEYEDPNTGEKKVVKVSEEVQESIKMDYAINLIMEAIDRGERVVLFSQFKSALTELQSRLYNMETDSGNFISSVRYDGDTPQSLRSEIKTNWDKKNGEAKKWDVLLANYKVGGTGLNLTAATTTIILDEEWNPGKRDQAYGRTRRLGQDQTTFVHVLRIERTVDTWLARLIEEKEAVIGGFESAAIDMQQEWLKAFNSGEMAA